MKRNIFFLLLFTTIPIFSMKEDQEDNVLKKIGCGTIYTIQGASELIPYYMGTQALALASEIGTDVDDCCYENKACIDSSTYDQLNGGLSLLVKSSWCLSLKSCLDAYRMVRCIQQKKNAGYTNMSSQSPSLCKKMLKGVLHGLVELTPYTMLLCNLYAADQLANLTVNNSTHAPCMRDVSDTIQTVSNLLHWSATGLLYTKAADSLRKLIHYSFSYKK